MSTLRNDAQTIINQAIEAVLPENAVQAKLQTLDLPSRVTVVAIGKAAWRMAQAAQATLAERVTQGIVITKYGHSLGEIPNIEIYEAGHPVLDENSLAATRRAIDLVQPLTESDHVLFLVSGGGSALFEQPSTGVSLADLTHVNQQLLKSGADIVEINTIRKHLSQVKGGRFASLVKPARVTALILSDVLGDRLDSIASGPAYPDATTSAEALQIVERYHLDLPPPVLTALQVETPKTVDNVTSHIIGSVSVVCEAAQQAAHDLGYQTALLTTTLDGEAREMGRFLAAIARQIRQGAGLMQPPAAIIVGGETVVTVRGNGLGGRSQEMALSASLGIAGLTGVVVAAVGTDGTDGPTDAAGGMVDGETVLRLRARDLNPQQALDNNDAYHALTASGDLLKTGPTGTNVNDVAILLVQ